MNKIYNLLSFLLVIIIITSILNNNNNNFYQESFVPRVIKETYRPIHRNIKRKCEGIYNTSCQHISNFFKKIGII